MEERNEDVSPGIDHIPPLVSYPPPANPMPLPEYHLHSLGNPLPDVDHFHLPVGCRFCPSDKQSLLHYLIPKLRGGVLPMNGIPEVDVYSASPEEITRAIPPISDGDWWFYSPRYRSSPKSSKPKRKAGVGYWKAAGSSKRILDDRSGEKIGEKRHMTYYRGISPNILKTPWVMREYVADGCKRETVSGFTLENLDTWVLCHVFKREEARVSTAVSTNIAPSAIVVDENVSTAGIVNQNVSTAPLPENIPTASASRNMNEPLPEYDIPVPAVAETFFDDLMFWNDVDLTTVDLSWLDDVP